MIGELKASFMSFENYENCEDSALQLKCKEVAPGILDNHNAGNVNKVAAV